MKKTGIGIGIAVYKNEDDDLLFCVNDLPDDFNNQEDVFEVIQHVLDEENQDQFILLTQTKHLAKFVDIIRENNYKDLQHGASHDLKEIFVEFKKVQE